MVYRCNQIAGVPDLRYPPIGEDLAVGNEKCSCVVRSVVSFATAAPGIDNPGEP